MYIKKISIRNYKNFWRAAFNFEKGVNTIVGENGSGKTNLFQAMRLLLDEGLSFKERKLASTDFSRKSGDWRGHWISVQAFFEEIGDSESEKILAYATMDLENVTTGSYSYLFRPKKEVRKKMYDLCMTFDDEALNEYISKIQISDYEYLFICKAKVDLSDEEEYKKYVGDFETNTFPDPDDKVYDEIWGNRNSRFNLFEHTSFTYIQALRDAVRELKYSRYSPLKFLFEDLNSEVEDEELKQIGTSVGKLNDQITALEPIKDFKSDLTRTLRSSVGFSYSPRIDIKSEISSEVSELLRSLALWVGDPNDEILGSLDDISLGGANLVYISIKLLEYKRKKAADRVMHFLAIEEPEAHLHTHIKKSLFANLDHDLAQVFVSTHSTHLSSASKISNMNILSAKAGYSEIYNPSNNLTPTEITKAERYLDAVRSNLVFAKGVVLVEGDAEEILIPVLFKNCLGVNLDELGISIVNIGSTGFENVAILFNEDRIRKHCSILTDSDKPFVSKNFEPHKFYLKQKRAHKISKLRVSKLEDEYFFEPWINIYTAKHTFEVDLVKESKNYTYFSKTLEQIYKGKIDKYKLELSDSDLEKKGYRALKMAELKGKGWFAIELAQHINTDFRIPKYILKAVANACPAKDREKIFNQIVRFMFKNERKNILKQKNMAEKLSCCPDSVAKDNLTDFVERWKNDSEF